MRCVEETAIALYQNRLAAFEYDSNWLANGFSISPFSLPLEKKVFMPKIDPVSYTHLDVYKRQVVGCFCGVDAVDCICSYIDRALEAKGHICAVDIRSEEHTSELQHRSLSRMPSSA